MDSAQDRIILIKPTASDKQAVLDFRDEFLRNQERPYGTADIENATSFESWLQASIDSQNQATAPKGRVPATQYLGIRTSDHKLVGMLQIRHSLNEHLRTHGGHIGYCVRRSERRKGYATQMLKQAVAICKDMGIHNIMLTCNPENTASAKVMQANGGTYTKQVVLDDRSKLDHYWIKLAK